MTIEDKDYAFGLLHELIKKHGQQRHFDALVALGFQADLTKEEAIALMKKGYKVTHYCLPNKNVMVGTVKTPTFCNQYIAYIYNGDGYTVITEEEDRISENEFWACRRSNVWDKGYKRA